MSIDASQMFGVLRDGQNALDLNASVVFQKYTRVVLPLDGFVFWSPADLVTVQGALHVAQDIIQDEDQTYGHATVTFTAQSQVTIFTDSPTNTIYVAAYGGFRYAFSAQQGHFDPAGIWHYLGNSIPPALASQLLDTAGMVDLTRAVVSNSLPVWLSLNAYEPPIFDGITNPVELFPSFMVPPNLTAPYGVVHIGDEDTRALQAVPRLSRNRSHYQLAADKVRITLYGLQNQEAADFLDMVLQYMTFYPDVMGLMNMPVIRDAKRIQSELLTIAMKKVIDFEVSYVQTRINDVARQYITSCVPDFIIDPQPNPSYTLATQSGISIGTQDGQDFEVNVPPDTNALGTQAGNTLWTQSNQELSSQ